MALAIHWFAADGQRQHTPTGHAVRQPGAATQLSPVLLRQKRRLATNGITLHGHCTRASSAVTLPAKDGPAHQDMDDHRRRPQQVPAIDGLDMRGRAAALTGVPVVRVARRGQRRMDERLRFIRHRMGMPPCGFRAKMTAGRTGTGHQTEPPVPAMFFQQRGPGGGEQEARPLVHLGRARAVTVPGGRRGRPYYGCGLDDKVTPAGNLALLQHDGTALPKRVGGHEAALRMVDEIRLGRRTRLRQCHLARLHRAAARATRPPARCRSGNRPVARLLRECDEHVRG